MNPKRLLLLSWLVLVSLVFKSQGLILSSLNVPLVSCQTCPGKRITILSNRERRNTLDVLLSTPLTTLSVSPAISEVIKLLIFLPSLTGAPEVLRHSVREYSWLLGLLLRPRETDLLSGRPKYQQLPQLLWGFNLLRRSYNNLSDLEIWWLEKGSPCSPGLHLAPGQR